MKEAYEISYNGKRPVVRFMPPELAERIKLYAIKSKFADIIIRPVKRG
jgi:hypothetical protein